MTLSWWTHVYRIKLLTLMVLFFKMISVVLLVPRRRRGDIVNQARPSVRPSVPDYLEIYTLDFSEILHSDFY